MMDGSCWRNWTRDDGRDAVKPKDDPVLSVWMNELYCAASVGLISRGLGWASQVATSVETGRVP